LDFFQEVASSLPSSRFIALQELAQKSSAAMNAALACLASDAQAIGHLADGELLHIAKQDHLAVHLRQRLQRTDEVDAQLVLRDLCKVLRLMAFRQLLGATYQPEHRKHAQPGDHTEYPACQGQRVAH